MKNLRIAPALLTLLLMESLAAAQTGDWQVVENLPRRSLISVEDMHQVIHETCRFQSVVDGQLFCEYGPHLFGPSEIAFRQESIRAVRREHNSTLMGLGIGAGAGAVYGAAADSSPGVGRGGSAIIGAGVFGAFGAIIGSAHGHFSHGKIIYQNPSDKTRTSEWLPTDGEPTNDFSTADRIAAAHSRYAQPENAASDVAPPHHSRPVPRPATRTTVLAVRISPVELPWHVEGKRQRTPRRNRRHHRLRHRRGNGRQGQ